MTEMIFGRDDELRAVLDALNGIRTGPTRLVIDGEAGIGKTTLWRAAVAAARAHSYTVLTCRPSASEAALAFAALGDLLEPVPDDIVTMLPEPQRRAFQVAMLKASAEGHAPDRRAVSVAVLSLVRLLCRSEPLVIAIDDLQWLDKASADTLSFVLRRLSAEPVALLAAARSDGRAGMLADLERSSTGRPTDTVHVGPLSLGALHHLLHAKLALSLPRPTLTRLLDVTRGNPLYALELARALKERGAPLEPGEPLPVPRPVRELMRLRLRKQPQGVRDVLLATAALSRPSTDILEQVHEPASHLRADLALAMTAGLLDVQGQRVELTHPLLGSVIYADAGVEEVERLHGRIAGVAGGAEERARHLALSSPGASDHIAAALDDASDVARSRGAPAVAADLLTLAASRTPPHRRDDLRRRRADAATCYYEAGDVTAAQHLLEEVIKDSPAGPVRAAALLRLAPVTHHCEGARQSVAVLTDALSEAGGDASLRTQIFRELSHACWLRGDPAMALAHADQAIDTARVVGDAFSASASTLHRLLVTALTRGVTPQALSQARSLVREAHASPSGVGLTTLESAEQTLALLLVVAGDFSEARDIYLAETRRLLAQGGEHAREYLAWCLARLELRVGDARSALPHAEESLLAATGNDGLRCEALHVRAQTAALSGDVELAVECASEGLSIADRLDLTLAALRNRSTLGFVHLSLGNPAAAHAFLGPAVSAAERIGLHEPAYIPLVPDDVEALVGLGLHAEAERLLDPFREMAVTLHRCWAVGAADRCAAMLLAARGDVPSALMHAARAVDAHRSAGQPFELGRTLLSLGTIERRARRWGDARRSLEEARDVFSGLQARLWEQSSRTELDRVGGRRALPGKLTATERQVAELVASGRTNREVAGLMFMSINTVESNLSRIYTKFGIRSRTALATHLTEASKG